MLGIALLTALRLAALFATRLELYPDEAQYWLWSRRLAFGYFSKPPVVAWLIAATTALGGNAEPWVRLSAPLIHAVAALAVQRAGARLYDERTGLAAAAVYALMPAVQLSSGVIATDAPLLGFLALALWSYATLATARSRREGDVAAVAFGALLALAMLSKYAAAYAVLGSLLHAVLNAEMRRRWSVRRLGLAVGVGCLLIAPNLAWNASHHFDTLAHTAANADWKGGPRAEAQNLIDRLSDYRGVLGFLIGQAGVFGPVFFCVAFGGALRLLFARRKPTAADALLLCFAAPPILIVIGQAALSRANANWAAPAFVPASVLAAAWLVRARAWRWLATGLGLQAVVAGLFLAAAVSPSLSAGLGLDNSLKVARGWRESTRWVRGQADAAAASAPLTAIALDDRFLFNALSYYGRDAAFPAPLKMWVREAKPHNQAEVEAPLSPDQGRRVLMIDSVSCYRPEAVADFANTEPPARTDVRLDAKRVRSLSAFIGEAFRPLPRNAPGGLPPRPAPLPAGCRIGQP
ncbi:glycosyltransferase family 39 protein [soil metagenome]